MKAFSCFSIFCYAVLFAGCIVTKNQPGASSLSATALKPVGRYAFDNAELQMISSGMYFGFTLNGTVCSLQVSSPEQHNYLQYELDGVYQKRIRVEKGNNGLIQIIAPKSGQHNVWIFKATEAHTGPVHIKKIEGQGLKALPAKQANLIEFIGNSITCGAAADPSEVPCGTGAYHDQHNAYMAYGPRVARSLGSAFILSSVSGIGIYRNWNSNGPAMPLVYEKTSLRQEGKALWDFIQFKPRVVSIALGTNDFSNGDGKSERLPFDSAAFVQNYITFVQLVKSKYKGTQIALLSSPMVHGSKAQLLQNCLTAVKNRIDDMKGDDKPVALFFFEPMQARGCTGHPNVEDHAMMANALIPFFKNLLRP